MSFVTYSNEQSGVRGVRRTAERALPIETVRVIATVLLVTYHVIGSTPSYGLQVDYPHPARLFADFFVDLRMPLFGFIAGMVFAIRPIGWPDVPKFLLGKVRRLLLPGAVAIALSVVAVKLVDTHFALDMPLWQLAVFPYLHYWFLMSIFLIFVLYAPIDALTGGRAALPAFVCAVVLYETGWTLEPNFFSINGAVYLLPYFLLGVLFYRNVDWIFAHGGWLFALAYLAAAVATWVNVAQYLDTGRFSTDLRDPQSLAFGFGVCVVAMMVLPRISLLSRFGPCSYTIYLYHVFATSLARRLMNAAGVENALAYIAVGLLAGIALPVLLHVVSARFAPTRVAVLGLRWKPDERSRRV